MASESSKYALHLVYQLPRLDRIQRLAVSKPRENDIFIAYASEAIDFARSVDNALRNEGFDPWVDTDGVVALNASGGLSEEYTWLINVGIRSADVFVLLLSEQVLHDAQLVKQLQAALKLNKLIVCISQSQGLQDIQQQLNLFDVRHIDIQADDAVGLVEEAVRTIIHLQTYVRLQARATVWDRRGRVLQHLLTVDDLNVVKEQKRWIETHELGSQFQFTEVQQVFLDAMDLAVQQSDALQKSQANVFVSYSRKDQKFVKRLNQAIKQHGWRTWVDWENIPIAVDWRQEVEEGIRAAHTFLFFISVDSTESENCQWELSKAFEYKKRIIPIVCREGYSYKTLQKIGLSSINYVSFTREDIDFCGALNQLLEALTTDLDDVRIYNRLLNQAHEWLESKREEWRLMPQQELLKIQQWHDNRLLAKEDDQRKVEPFLPLQEEYIYASQQHHLILSQQRDLEKAKVRRKRQRFVWSAVIGGVVGLFGMFLNTTFGEIRALVRSLDDPQGLDTLIIGLQAGQRVQKNALFISLFRPGLYAQVTTIMHRSSLNQSEMKRFEDHDGKVFSVVFSPDGERLVSVGDDKAVRFWSLSQQAKTSKEEQEHNIRSCQSSQERNIGSHGASVRTVAYSSDQEYVATGDVDGYVKLWTCDGQLYKTLPQRHQVRDVQRKTQGARVNRVEFSPGGYYLASVGVDGRIRLWTRSNNFMVPTVLEHQDQAEIISMTFSPNGKYLASADAEGHVYWWAVKHQKQGLPVVELLDIFQYQAAENLRLVTTVVFSPDSSLLAFAGLGSVIQVQDLNQKTDQLLTGHEGFVYKLLFSSDGRTLASAGADATIKLWNPRLKQGEKLVHTLRGHQGPVYRLAFGPQDDVLATGGKDGIVRLWLRDKGIQIDTFEGHKDEISSLAFAPKPSLERTTILASASDDGSIRLWNIDNPIQLLRHNSNVFDVAFRSDGRVVASGGVRTVRLWRRDGTSKSSIAFSDPKGEPHKIWAVDYSPNGQILAAGGSNGQIKLWKPEIDTAMPFQILDAHDTSDDLGNSQGVLDLSFSGDGRWLASVGTDRTLKLWQVRNNWLYRYLTLEHPDNDVLTAVAFSRDSKLLATGTRASSANIQRGIFLWEMSSQSASQKKIAPKFKTVEKHQGSILSIAIQPNEQGLIASGGEDGTINLWKPSGKWLKTLKGHTDAITQVHFSADGRFLASSSDDATIMLWTAEGDLISILERHNGAVSSVAFGPEGGYTLASSSAREDVLIWDLWDLSKVELTSRNQKSQMLDVLVTDACETVLPFLEDDYQSVWLNSSDRDWLKERERLKDFCNESSVVSGVRR